MKRTAILLGFLALAGVAHADDPHCRREVWPYHRRATGNVAYCNKGDFAMGGGGTCSVDPAVIRQSVYVFNQTSGLQGWKVNCASTGTGAHVPTISTDVTCLQGYLTTESTCLLPQGEEDVTFPLGYNPAIN